MTSECSHRFMSINNVKGNSIKFNTEPIQEPDKITVWIQSCAMVHNWPVHRQQYM